MMDKRIAIIVAILVIIVKIVMKLLKHQSTVDLEKTDDLKELNSITELFMIH